MPIQLFNLNFLNNAKIDGKSEGRELAYSVEKLFFRTPRNFHELLLHLQIALEGF
jgi:hypothetical protein